MTAPLWLSAKEIATQICGMTNPEAIALYVMKLYKRVERKSLPTWAYRRVGKRIEFSPHFFIAPVPPVPEVRPMLGPRTENRNRGIHKILSAGVGVKR